MNGGIINQLIKIMESNKANKLLTKININKLKKLYEIVSNYEYPTMSFDDMIRNPVTRLNFLSSSINLLLEDEDDLVSDEIRLLALDMFDSLYVYFMEGNKLRDIEIPKSIKDRMLIFEGIKKDSLLIPTSTELDFLYHLIHENKEIYDSEFNGRDLSIKITEGLHTNITELLEIEEKDVSHLLGTNNDSHHMFAFYRKCLIDKKLKTMGEKGTPEFNEKFVQTFGLPYSKENYQKLINLKYGDIEKWFKSGDITEEQKEKLSKSYDEASKSMTIHFYNNKENFEELKKEIASNADFIYDYIRKKIVRDKLSNKQQLATLLANLPYDEQEKKIFVEKMKDLSINSNNKEIRKYIDTYIKIYNINLKGDNTFKQEFKQKFDYDYPLIDYYEALTKNISFYNFSLLKNLRSLIVDFQPKMKDGKELPIEGDKGESEEKIDTYLVSYSIDKRKKAREEFDAKFNAEKELAKEEDADIADSYIAALRSLYFFHEDDRYYFEKKFEEIPQRRYEEIKDNPDIFSLMGFCTPSDESTRIKTITTEVGEPIQRQHNWKTNQTRNYRGYLTKELFYGQEYPIDVIESFDPSTNLKYIMSINILGPDGLGECVTRLNEYRAMVANGLHPNIEYEKKLTDMIVGIAKGYVDLISTKIKALKFRKKYCADDQKDKYDALIYNEEALLNKFNVYYERTKSYFNGYGKGFEDGMNKNAFKQIEDIPHKRR